MMARTHALTAVTPAIILISHYHIHGVEMFVFVAGILLGSLFPDIDEPRSYIGRKIPFVSIILSSFIRHRGATHFLIFSVTITLLTYIFASGYTALFFYAFALGCLIHSLGDMVTNNGIRGFFYPVYDGHVVLLPKQLRFDTGSFGEVIFFWFLVVLNLVLYNHLFVR